MKILALVDGEDHVCCRYRIAAFRPHLERAGHSLSIRGLPGGTLARLRVFSAARRADAVILQRKLLSRFELAFLRRRAARLIFDFDDAIWLRDSHSIKGFESVKRASRFAAVLTAADAVAAGNRVLADRCRTLVDPARLHVIPTCVDPAEYVPVERGTSDGPIRLVWVGSSSTLKGLEARRELFEALGRAISGLRLKVICDRFPHFEHLPVDPVPWRRETEGAEIAAADIGIAWVPDDPWSRGKCALKVLQYQAAGLPVLANPVGIQVGIVVPGVNGYLAESEAEWIAAIRTLAGDGALRRRFGAAGREQVRRSYSVDAGGSAWVALLAGMERIAPC